MPYGSASRKLGRRIAVIAGRQSNAVIVACGMFCLAAPLALAMAFVSPNAAPAPRHIAACWMTSSPAFENARTGACNTPGDPSTVAMLMHHRSPRFMIIPGRFEGARGGQLMHWHSAVQFLVINPWMRRDGHRL